MELRHLRYFVAIAEEGSFTGAAERLWIAQPGLSTQMRRLEAELDVKLLERLARGVALTEAGDLFLGRARATLDAADAALATGRDLQAGLVGTVRLGIATGAGWPRTPELLDGFGRDRPEIEVTVVESYGGTLSRDLDDGRLDAVLAPSSFCAVDLFRRSLGREPWLVLIGPGHPLAGTRGPVAAEDLEPETFVVTGHRDGAAYDRAVADALAGAGIEPAVQRGGPGPALFAAVAAGEALALTASTDAAVGGMVTRPLAPACEIDFALAWGAEAPAPALQQLISAAQALTAPAPPVLRAVA